MEKLLVKDQHGKCELPEDTRDQVQDAFHALTSEQIDRYYRARKVFFISKTQTFEYEDVA